MLQGEALISVEKKMGRPRQTVIQRFIAEQCSPEVSTQISLECS